MTEELYTWWVGWEVPDMVPEENAVETWPDGMRGWLSGHGNGYKTWTGRVDAPSAAEAWATVLRCYGPSCGDIKQRWEPRQHPLGWRPGDRFPEPPSKRKAPT